MTALQAILRPLLLAFLLPILAAAAMAAPPELARTLERLERDLGGAMGLVQSLREQVATAGLDEAAAASAAGIADGGYVSTLRALRAASRLLLRRVDELHDHLPTLDDPHADEVLLAMHLELAAVELAFEDVLIEASVVGRQEALARIDLALRSLDGATAAVWTLDGIRAARGDERDPWLARGEALSPPSDRPPPPRSARSPQIPVP